MQLFRVVLNYDQFKLDVKGKTLKYVKDAYDFVEVNDSKTIAYVTVAGAVYKLRIRPNGKVGVDSRLELFDYGESCGSFHIDILRGILDGFYLDTFKKIDIALCKHVFGIPFSELKRNMQSSYGGAYIYELDIHDVFNRYIQVVVREDERGYARMTGRGLTLFHDNCEAVVPNFQRQDITFLAHF